MGWELEGQYFENCSCDAICPCTWSNLSRAATRDDCRATLVFKVERGTVNDVDVSGRTIVLAVQAPKMMADGNWRVGLVADEQATDEQMDALSKVFTGELGGPMAGLAPLVGEILGAERAAIDVQPGEDGWIVRVGSETELQGTTERAPDAEAVTLTGIVARYIDAWNDHDAAACGDCFAPDGVREWRVLAPPHIGGDPFPRFVGRRAIAERIAHFIASVPDLELDVTGLSEGSDDRIWTEWRARGTHTIDLGAWQARGEPLDYVGVSIFRIGPRGIEEEVVYWDTLLMLGSQVEATAGY
jgi:hypothetical protein